MEMGENSGVGMVGAIHYQDDAAVVGDSEALTTLPQSTTPTSVYLYYDEVGILIYVGVTRTGILRNRQHNDDKEWWPFVSAQKIEHCQSAEIALDREKALIQKYRPPFNKQHNPDHAPMRAAYMAAKQGDAFWMTHLQGVESSRLMLHVSLVSSDWKRGEVELRSSTTPLDVVGSLVFQDKRPVITADAMHLGSIYALEREGFSTIVRARIKAPWRMRNGYLHLKRRGSFVTIKKLVALDAWKGSIAA